MALSSFINTNKLFYILIGAVAFIVLITVIIIIGNVGGGGAQAELEFWGVYDTRKDFARVISAFKQVQPGIKINYRQFSYEDYERALIDALAAGAGPDLIMIHNTWLARHRAKLVSMPEFSKSDKDIKFMTLSEFQNQFVETAYDDFVYKDKIYAFPLYVDTLALFYNRDMFNTAGITGPPKNWDDFSKDVESLAKFDSKGNIIQAGAAIGTARNINRSSDILAALMIQNGTRMTDPTNSIATFTRSVDAQRVGENALQYYTDFANPVKTVYTWDDNQHYSVDAFVEGKVAMMFNYSHQIPVIRDKFERLNFSVGPLPQFSDLDVRNYANYWGVGVSAASKKQDAAWRFLNYLASKDGSLIYLTDTSRPSARRDIIDLQRNDPQLGVFAVQALSAKSWYQVDNNAVEQIFADMIDEVNLKKAKIRDALRAAESKINTLMSKRPQ